MKGYYSVSYKDEGKRFDCCLLFKPSGKTNAADLADAIRDSLRIITYPDAVVIVSVPSEVDEIFNLCENDQSVLRSLERASNKVTIAICNVEINGDLGVLRFIKNERPELNALSADSASIYEAGLEQLFSSPNVLMRAPAGFIFLKPSGNRSSYFLRAEEAIFETDRVHFLACSLLFAIYERSQTCSHIEVIFIDTMAIASVAYVLRDLYVDLYKLSYRPRIVSFHSYGGMEKVGKPFPGKSMCLISASSSMSMQRDWLELTQCGPKEVVTLVTLTGEVDADSALFRLPQRHSDLQSTKDGPFKDLRIVGENFSPEEIAPKEVLLKVKQHKLTRWGETAPIYSEAKLFTVLRRDECSGNVRPIHLNGELLVKQDCMKEFAGCVVNQKLPVSVKKVIYQNDLPSKELGKYCVCLIENAIGNQIPLVCADSIRCCEFEDGEGLLIVAAVIGRGTKLLSLSRDLREHHKGPRQYLVGFHLAERMDDEMRLKSNLEFTPKKWNIELNTMEFLALGVTEDSLSNNEVNVIESLTPDCLTAEIKDRLVSLKGNSSCSNGAFLPPMKTASKSLVLRPDFALWSSDYKEEVDHSGAVLATVAAVLQRAREFDATVEEEARLSSDAFQQVNLSPENFARFNDGILQAALLRCAHAQELDFFSNKIASSRMKAILIGIFSASDREQGEAALEFALALASGKMRLAPDDEKSLIKEVLNILDGNHGKVRLLKALIKAIRRKAKKKLPF